MLRPSKHQETSGKDNKPARHWVKDHGLLLVLGRVGIGFAHEDENLAGRITRA